MEAMPPHPPLYNPALRHPVFFTESLRKPPFPLPFSSAHSFSFSPVAAGYVLEQRRLPAGRATGAKL